MHSWFRAKTVLCMFGFLNKGNQRCYLLHSLELSSLMFHSISAEDCSVLTSVLAMLSVAQVVRYGLLTTEAQVQSQGSPYGDFCGQSVFPSVILLPMLHNHSSVIQGYCNRPRSNCSTKRLSPLCCLPEKKNSIWLSLCDTLILYYFSGNLMGH